MLDHALDEEGAFLVEDADKVFFFLAVHEGGVFACAPDGRLEDGKAGIAGAGGKGLAHVAFQRIHVQQGVQHGLEVQQVGKVDVHAEGADDPAVGPAQERGGGLEGFAARRGRGIAHDVRHIVALLAPGLDHDVGDGRAQLAAGKAAFQMDEGVLEIAEIMDGDLAQRPQGPLQHAGLPDGIGKDGAFFFTERRQGPGMGGGHDEREQTLNQLLVEMDGFGVNEGIIVMAATNRVDILDPAILRPGRFDRKVAVGRPDVKGREEILKVHSKEKPLSEDVDLRRVAQTTAGFTGADLENLMNEAAIISARDNRRFIRQADIDKAFVKVGIGAEKKSRVISEKDKKITAYHEAGHAILFHVLPDVGPVHTVSIIPTGVGAAGYTMPLPEKDEMFNTKGKMLQNIMVDLGGRIAEEIIFKDVTTGASQDIKQASKLARAMVTQYGMSDRVGMIQYGSDEDEVFIGRDLAHTKSYGNEIADVIDEEVKRIVDECYTKAKNIILEHEDVLHSCAALLIEKEKIGQEEFEALFKNHEPVMHNDGEM